jgi:hypothetical protein
MNVTRWRRSSIALASSTETYFSGTGGLPAGAGAAHAMALAKSRIAMGRFIRHALP